MEYLLGIIAVLGGGVFYLWRQLQQSKADASLAETKGKDSILERDQKEIDEQIEKLDEGIKKMNEDRKKRQEEEKNLSLAERAKRW